MHFQKFIQSIENYHLLQHPFYQDWQKGQLTKEDLQYYAVQYYHHIHIFPRHISAIHTQCEDLPSRQILLANLCDEEQGPNNHPTLWLQFAQSLDMSKEDVIFSQSNRATANLITSFRQCTQSSYEEGLGALIAQEYQVPAIAASKLEGLKKYYQIEERQAEYFVVHATVDQEHTQACWSLIEALPLSKQKKAQKSAKHIAQYLWKFLDGVQNRKRKEKM